MFSSEKESGQRGKRPFELSTGGGQKEAGQQMTWGEPCLEVDTSEWGNVREKGCEQKVMDQLRTKQGTQSWGGANSIYALNKGQPGPSYKKK